MTWWSSCWKKGADINDVCYVYENLEHNLYGDEKAGSPLQRAIRNDKYEMLRLLSTRGAYVTLQAARGKPPLSLARERRNYELVEKLTDRGAKTYLGHEQDCRPMKEGVLVIYL